MLSLDVAHAGLGRLEVVGSMHERKARMISLADGMIALPGGFGTLEELFEALSWSQLDLHRKPVALLNVNRYYDGLLQFLNRSMDDGFMSKQHRKLLVEATDPSELLHRLSPFI
jgi:hypothetical protein